MKGENLGEFEELTLLMVANLANDAYGISIRGEIKKLSGRSVSLSAVHTTLHRLEKKGYLLSRYDNSYITVRGGRPKLVFIITGNGMEALNHSRELRNQLWNTIPLIDPSHG